MRIPALEPYFKTDFFTKKLSNLAQTAYERTPLLLAFERGVKLNTEELDYLIKNSDLKYHTKTGYNALIMFLESEKSENKLTSEQFDYLIKNSNLRLTNLMGRDALILIMENKERLNIDLTSEQLDLLIKSSDLRSQDKDENTSLMLALKSNKYNYLNLTSKQLDVLIKHSALTTWNKNFNTPLMLALLCNKEQELYLNTNQLDILITNSDLKFTNENGYNPLMLSLLCNKEQKLHLNLNQLEYLIENSDLQQKTKKGNSWLDCYFQCIDKDQSLISEKITYEIFKYLEKNPKEINNAISNFSKYNDKVFNLSQEHYFYLIDKLLKSEKSVSGQLLVSLSEGKIKISESDLNTLIYCANMTEEDVFKVFKNDGFNNEQLKLILVKSIFIFNTKTQYELKNLIESQYHGNKAEELKSFFDLLVKNKNEALNLVVNELKNIKEDTFNEIESNLGIKKLQTYCFLKSYIESEVTTSTNSDDFSLKLQSKLPLTSKEISERFEILKKKLGSNCFVLPVKNVNIRSLQHVEEKIKTMRATEVVKSSEIILTPKKDKNIQQSNTTQENSSQKIYEKIKNTDFNKLSNVEQNKLLIDTICVSYENNDRETLNYLLNNFDIKSTSLNWLNDKLDLKLDVNNQNMKTSIELSNNNKIKKGM